MASAEPEFGVHESGNSSEDDPRQAANGEPAMTSPELVLVAGDEEARHARDSLEPIVPTDERINAEMRARAASQLRLAPPAAAAAAVLPAAVPAAEPRPEQPEPEPEAEAVPAAVPPAAEPLPKQRRRRVRPAIGLLALVPVAVAGLALGLHWNPFATSTTIPTTTAAAAPAPPPTHQVGTATSAGVTTAPASPTTQQAPTAAQTSGGPAPATHPRTTTHPHAATATAPAHTAPAHTAPAHTATATHPTTAPRPARTTKPTTSSKPPAKPPTITPSRTFAWAAMPNASFYLVRFARDGTKVFERRVTEPRLTLPASFRFKAGSYRWTVVPALGTAANPRYAPAIIDSRFIVAS
jgi:hypothetical protein